MAELKVPKIPSKEWVESTIDSVKKAQEIYATDPEGYREYLKGVERKGKEVIPKGLTDEEKIAQMETNMKALIDHDPDLIKSFDIERMKKSFTYMNKVKERFEGSNPETYKQFLAVWESETIPQPPADRAWERIHTQMKVVLADDPDLLEELESLSPPGMKDS